MVLWSASGSGLDRNITQTNEKKMFLIICNIYTNTNDDHIERRIISDCVVYVRMRPDKGARCIYMAFT